MTIHNFSAGPGILPACVLQEAAAQLSNFRGTGLSILEVSHRSRPYRDLQEEATASWRQVYDVPADYEVLFLQGGASTQFAAVPLNLIGAGESADYVNTGRWSQKAIEEVAELGRDHRVAATSQDKGHNYIPAQAQLQLDRRARYLHITSNNTIFGTQYANWPDAGDVPLVVDASSDMLSRPLRWDRLGLLYGGAQKNAGISGLTVVCLRPDLIPCRSGNVPKMLRYETHAEAQSLYNTPPTFGVLVLSLILQWIEDQGGLAAVAGNNERKATVLYDVLDGSGFYQGHADVDSRSVMNVVFRIAERILEEEFCTMAEDQGLVGLKGHRAAGGIRASIYNAMTIEGCRSLADFMVDFARKKG